MDSGNSGSLQSSSGGDEEYDSRAESISAFMNNNPTGQVGPVSNPPPSSYHHHHHHHHIHGSEFDPLSIYLNPISQQQPLPPANPNSSLLNLDMIWSKALRSDPNCTAHFNSVLASSSSPAAQPIFSPFQSPAGSFHAAGATTTPPRAAAQPDQTQPVRNPKKRSRASRRAPTTVLTTDTTNFRAMVQEFTGIPAAPFTSSPFPRSRLDIFGTPSSIRSNPLDTSQPSYLLRSFPKNVIPPPPPTPPQFFSSSSSSSLSSSLLIEAIASSSSTTNNINSCSTITCSNNPTSLSYQLPPSPPSSGLLTLQNPLLQFHSLPQLQQPLTLKYPLHNPGIFGQKLGIPSNYAPHVKLGGSDNGNSSVDGLPNLISSEATTPRDHEAINFDSTREVGNTKQNYLLASSTSNLKGQKGPEENVGTRGEGMVESWICSSD